MVTIMCLKTFIKIFHVNSIKIKISMKSDLVRLSEYKKLRAKSLNKNDLQKISGNRMLRSGKNVCYKRDFLMRLLKIFQYTTISERRKWL